jgi:iron complex outermembrane receptor protein
MAQGDIYYGVYDENDAKKTLTRDELISNPLLRNQAEKKGGNILVRWNFNQSLASRMSAQLFYDAFQIQESLSNPASMNSEIVDFDFQHVLAPNEEHELTWGFNYRLSTVQLKAKIDSIGKKEYLPRTFQNHRFGVFFQDKWRWDDDVEITFGSKFEHHNNSDFEYEPSLRVLWKAANQHRLWAGVSRAVRLPSVTDLPSQVTQISDIQEFRFNQNQKLTSDEVISYELGYRYWNTDSFSLDVAAFYNQYTSDLLANLEFFQWFPERQIKKSTSLGLEASLVWRPLDWTRFQLTSSVMDMDIQAKRTLVNILGVNTSEDPKFLFAFRSSFDITSEFEADLWLRYADSVSGVIADQAIPGYVTLDARLAWKPNKHLELSFVGTNLNDSRHPEFYDGLGNNPLQVERMFWLQGNLKY